MNITILWFSVFASICAWTTLVYLNWDRLGVSGGRDAQFNFLASIHVFRFIGLIALVPTHMDGAAFGFSHAYLMQVGWGDAAAGLLACLAIVATKQQWSWRRFFQWVFVLVGTIDTLNAGPNFILGITDQNQVQAIGWLVLTFYVPALIVTEIMLIWLLLTRCKTKPSAAQQQL